MDVRSQHAAGNFHHFSGFVYGVGGGGAALEEEEEVECENVRIDVEQEVEMREICVVYLF